MADSLLNITVGIHEDPATVADRLITTDETASAMVQTQRLMRELGGLAAKDAKITMRVDSLTRGASAGVVVVTAADCTAGDLFYIRLPGQKRATFTCVATDAEVTAAPGTGLYSIETATDTAVGASLAAAVNGLKLSGTWLTAVNASGTVTITADSPGSWADSIGMDKVVTTGTALAITAFTGGDDVLDQPTMTVTFGSADIVADDTISIGGRVYTWKASASADGEITLSTTEATAATNFGAAVNADTHMTGICTASVATAVVTLTFEGDPRLSKHVGVDFTETNSGSVTLGGVATGGATSETPTPGSTATGQSVTSTLGGRGAA